MLRNTTLNLPEDLVARARAYAAAQGTTMTAIIRSHLEAVTGAAIEPVPADPLLAFSRGLLSRADTLAALGLRDYAELLVALGDADLPIPQPPPHVVEDQAATFANIWRRT